MEFKTDIPNMLAPWERVPAHRRLSASLPPEAKEMVQEMGRSVKGKHPFHVYMTGYQFGQAAFGAPGSTQEVMFMAACAVGAFIERTDLNQDEVSDPFLAALYRLSAKTNHAVAAEKFIRAAGGWPAVEKEMNECLSENPSIISEGGAGQRFATGHAIEPDTPESPKQSVERVCGMVREDLKETGSIFLMFVVLDDCGRGIAFIDPHGSGSKEASQAFIETAGKAGRETVAGASRFIRVTEAWIGDNPEIRPSDSETRREAAVVALWDEEKDINGQLTLLWIDRDENGRQVIVGEEQTIGEGARADWNTMDHLVRVDD